MTLKRKIGSPAHFTPAWRKITAFSPLSENALRHLSQHLHERVFRLNETLYRQDEPAMALFFIIDGSVGLFVNGPEDRQERIKVILAGGVCGLAAVTPKTIHRESAVALEPSIALTLMRSEWQQLSAEHPGIGLALLSSLSNELLSGWHGAVDEYIALTRQLAKSHIIL